MIYHVTERLVIDDELEFSIDINRAVELINQHHSVACGGFAEAEQVLLGLGLTRASAKVLLTKAIHNNDMEVTDVVPG